MKIIFITLVAINKLSDRNLYADLMRYFVKQGHHVSIVSPAERRAKMPTQLRAFPDHNILRVKTLNVTKANFLEKGIGTFLIDQLLAKAIDKYLGDREFDLAIYSTPPITLVKTIASLKDKHQLKTYLLLKDIFPQNAVDLGFIKKNSWMYNFFRSKEMKLYELSDKIGCMSQANVDYVLRENPKMSPHKVEIAPNSIEVIQSDVEKVNKEAIRDKFGINNEQKVFIYGGNLGKPQGIDFLIEVLTSQSDNEKAFFIIVGSGTEYNKLESWVATNRPKNVLLQAQLPKDEYDQLVKIADVGMIFLDHKFTIPNYPSRLLAYLENKIPVLAVTDENTDVGKNAEERGYGKWSPSNDLQSTNEAINYFCTCSDSVRLRMAENGFSFLMNNYSVEHTYSKIIGN